MLKRESKLKLQFDKSYKLKKDDNKCRKYYRNKGINIVYS